MKKIFAMACLAISALGFSAQAADHYIYTVADLQALASRVNGGQDCSGDTYYLMNDLDLSGISNWTPIGYLNGQLISAQMNETRYFNGTFDGQNHTISKINIAFNNTSEVTAKGRVTSGLFGAINGGTIKNLVVRDSYIQHKTTAYYNYCGGIVAYARSGKIENCSSINNTIKAESPYNAAGARGSAYAGGICGASGNYKTKTPLLASKIEDFETTTNTAIQNCSVAGNTVIADGKRTSKAPDISHGASQTGNVKYNSVNEWQTAQENKFAAINDNTIKKNNFGVNSGETANYYLNPQTGVATDYNYYVFMGVDDSKAQTGSLRQNSTYTDGALMTPYNYNGYNYKLYPSGKVAVTITFYLEGFKGNWSDAGFFIERIYNTETGADIQKNLIATYGNDGLDKDGNATYNANTDRFMRTEVYELIMPANVTSVAYTTYKIVPSSIESTAQEAVQVYGTNGALVVNAAAATELVVVSIDGRVVYNDMVEGNARIELPAGIYIANNHKVVVR